MDILDQYEKTKEKSEEVGKKPSWEPTLKEILNNSDQAEIFGKILEKENNRDLLQKITTGTLEVSDIDDVETARDKFIEMWEKIERTKKLITIDNVETIAKSSPDLERILKLVGPEVAVKIVQSQIEDMAVEETDRFNAISGSLFCMEDSKAEKNKEIEDEIDEFCTIHHLSKDRYRAVIMMSDDDKREEAIRKLVKKNQGKIKKGWKWLSGDNASSIDSIREMRDKIESTLEEIAEDKEAVGEILASSVIDNDEMRRMLVNSMNEIEEKTPEPIVSLKELKKSIPIPTDEEIDEAWEKFKTEDSDGMIWGSIDPADVTAKETVRTKFIEKQKRERGEKPAAKKGGFWSTIFGITYDAQLLAHKNNLN